MSPLAPGLACLLACLLVGLADGPSTVHAGPLPQEGGTPLERAREGRGADSHGGATGEPFLGPDGKPLLPGALPEDASLEARAAWEVLVRTSVAPMPVRAFDLRFYLLRRDEGAARNDLKARIQFLAPGYVRAVLQSGRQHLRGPDGDFLIDGEEKLRLVGREGAQDRRQIDEIVAIARNFASLTDPASLRIARLALSPAPALPLPERLREIAARLEWIEIASPDLVVHQSAAPAAGPRDAQRTLQRALLGVDPDTKRIRLALIGEERAAPARDPSTLLVELDRHGERDGFLVPHRIRLYELARQTMPPRLREDPSFELDLMRDGVRLRPDFTPADFGADRPGIDW